jgi:hypothetical protein
MKDFSGLLKRLSETNARDFSHAGPSVYEADLSSLPLQVRVSGSAGRADRLVVSSNTRLETLLLRDVPASRLLHGSQWAIVLVSIMTEFGSHDLKDGFGLLSRPKKNGIASWPRGNVNAL